jgi:putative ubiquitin-RnfH superfamily antitoxin RatB of RatAB toxin-antitoxin module
MANVSGKSERMVVEVAYATPARQVVIAVQVDLSVTVAAAIYQSGILQEFPEVDLAVNAVGVFGNRARLGDQLRPGDRVEIYRALQIAPNEGRKRRALRRRRGLDDRR